MKTKKKFYLTSSIMLLLSLILVPINSANAGENSSTIQGTLISTGNSGTVTSYCTLGSDGLCTNFKYSCDADGVATMDSAVNGYGKIGDILWEGNAPGCHKGIFSSGTKYSSTNHLVECLSYYQVYRFYGKVSKIDQYVSSSKIYPVNDCQNADVNGINTTSARLANPNPTDAVAMPLGSPWNNLNIPTARVTNMNITQNLITVASDACGNNLKKAKDGNCQLTTGKPKALQGSASSCSSLYVPAADAVKSYVNSTTKVDINGTLVVLGDAVKDRIYSLIEPYLNDNTYSSSNILSAGWLPIKNLTGVNQLPASASDINTLGNNLDCSSLLQYIPTIQPTTPTPDNNNFTTCVVAVGTLADSFLSNGDLYFQHHGPTILAGNYVQERYMKTVWTADNMIGQSDLTKYSTISASSVLNASTTLKNQIVKTDVNGNVDPASITNDSSLQAATKGKSTDKIDSFTKYAKCYQVTMNTSLFTTITDPLCPDGSAIPASGVCPVTQVICPDGSVKPANGTCPVPPLTPSACTGNPCININLTTPKQFVVGGTLRPQKVTATATYANIAKCGHYICRASANAASNITVKLNSSASGGYMACNMPISNPKSPAGCSYTQAITNSNSNNTATIDYQFFSAANPNEKITITASASGFYDYADQVQDPCVDKTFTRGSVTTTICVFPPKRTVWTYNAPVSSFEQSPTGGSTVIGTVGN